MRVSGSIRRNKDRQRKENAASRDGKWRDRSVHPELYAESNATKGNNDGIKRRDAMKSRRGNEAEDTRKIILVTMVVWEQPMLFGIFKVDSDMVGMVE